jgi:ferric-dicitrate binding protein FerR (iron transport regulator)
MSLSESPQPAVSWDALDRYLAGECTSAEEMAAVHAYLARVENAEDLLKHASRLADRPQTPPSSVEGWNALAIRLNTDLSQHTLSLEVSSIAHERGVHTLSSRVFKAQPLRRSLWYAATGAVLAGLVIVLGWNGPVRHLFGHTPSARSTYITSNGERANIVLPDGSTVALDVASRLDVPVDYSAGNHVVYLLGEALFTVNRHTGMPFTVIAGTTTTQVLGTSFTVRHYGTDTTATVAVRDGKVAIGDVVLTAGRSLEVGPHGLAQVRPTDAAQFGFAIGVLEFKSRPLSQAVTELDRWYAADIRLGDTSLAAIPIEGKFTAGSLSDLVEILEFELNVRVVRVGRILTLYPKAR